MFSLILQVNVSRDCGLFNRYIQATCKLGPLWLVGFLFGSVILEAVSGIKSITQLTDHSDTYFKSDRKREFLLSCCNIGLNLNQGHWLPNQSR